MTAGTGIVVVSGCLVLDPSVVSRVSADDVRNKTREVMAGIEEILHKAALSLAGSETGGSAHSPPASAEVASAGETRALQAMVHVESSCRPILPAPSSLEVPVPPPEVPAPSPKVPVPLSARAQTGGQISPPGAINEAAIEEGVGKVADAEEEVLKQMSSIVDNARKSAELVLQVIKKVDSAQKCEAIALQIFNKALSDPGNSQLYAKFCKDLSQWLPKLPEGDEDSFRWVSFKETLLNLCQKVFLGGTKKMTEEEEKEVERVPQFTQSTKLPQYIQWYDVECTRKYERQQKVEGRMRGFTSFMAELFNQGVLTPTFMHECIRKLLSNHQDPEDEPIENLCMLLCRIGAQLETPAAPECMNVYMSSFDKMSRNEKLSRRTRLILGGVVGRRDDKWQEFGSRKSFILHGNMMDENEPGSTSSGVVD